ncbi:Ccr4-not transcription complex subunit 1 [Globisporangium polare]
MKFPRKLSHQSDTPAMGLPDCNLSMTYGVDAVLDWKPISSVTQKAILLAKSTRKTALQVWQLPEVRESPRLMLAWVSALAHSGIKDYVDEFLRATSSS